MNRTAVFILVTVFLLSGCSTRNTPGGKTAKIIFDTDLGPDYDDVGALAVLHAMADSGRAEILGTMASNKHELVAPSIEAVNRYFGRADLPIGAPKTPGVSMTASQHWPDSLVAKYPHKIKSTDEVPDAVGLYRKILSSQPDSSVTIITVGFLTNLANLLKSVPDSISPLTGEELVSKKVKLLVSMAGIFPMGKEFNVFMDSVSSEYVFNIWPGKIIFTGFEIGSKIFTGLRLVNSGIVNSPVKDVFRIAMNFSEEDSKGRMSWDETAVLIGVYGADKFFDTKRGRIIVNPDGSNRWEDDPAGKQQHVTLKMPVPEIEKFIEERMMHLPINK
jgi:pyrimidine-specific ribonucleoside hydrolase